ncbi:MAG: squalene/phytoene synthase family protein [Myxococcota bacterium]
MSTLLLPKNVTAAQLGQALEACEVVAAKDRSNLYITSQFFEDRARYDAFIAMYAVMRLVDDFIDNVPDKSRLDDAGKARLKTELDRWEQRIRDAYDDRPSTDPIDVGLSAAAKTFPVPIKVWLNFIDAMRFDVDHPRFQDFPEFLSYGEGATVAPTVIYVYLLTAVRDASSGQYLVRDFDFETCGRELGLFAYLAHILRDVAEDMRVGETGLVYLTVADMAAHGLNEQEVRKLIQRGDGDERWRGLVREICRRAHVMEQKGVALADPQYAKMDQDCAFILNLIITVYQELLRRIEERPDAVLRSDPMMSGEDKMNLAVASAQRTGYPLQKVAEKMAPRG